MWSICSDSNVCGQLLENQIFFGRFLKSSWYSLSRTLWIFRWSIPRHNILEFGGRMCNICSDSLLCGQLLGNQISFCDCRTGHDSPWAGRDGSFVGTYQTTTYSNLVAECEISARAVFYVENFGIIKNFFGWFLNISQYPWAQNCGSIIGICQSST